MLTEVSHPPAETDRELSALRSELRLRISLQNMLLFFTTGLFAVFFTLLLAWPGRGWLIATGFVAASLSCALQWGHHGIRTKQLKAYILRKEAALGAAGAQTWETWETWLPGQRPPGLLGGRWFISTKGVFLGLQGAMLLACALSTPLLGWQAGCAAALALALLIFTGWYLISNPKE